MKLNRKGQASLLDRKKYLQILHELKNPRHRLIFQIGAYTAERWGAIRQLKITDVFNLDGSVKEYITFDRETRKGKKDARSVKIHPELKKELNDYQLPTETVFLFPSPVDRNRSISQDACDDFLRKVLNKLGLVGISTHSTRRTTITNFYRQSGGKIAETKQFSGHRSIRTLIDCYVEVNPEEIDKLAANLVPCV
ncbi:MAG: tyrosine-type recombinase/integrase [Xenococcaceae cyanobacterium]